MSNNRMDRSHRRIAACCQRNDRQSDDEDFGAHFTDDARGISPAQLLDEGLARSRLGPVTRFPRHRARDPFGCRRGRPGRYPAHEPGDDQGRCRLPQ